MEHMRSASMKTLPARLWDSETAWQGCRNCPTLRRLRDLRLGMHEFPSCQPEEIFLNF